MSPPEQAPDFLAEHGWGGAAILPLAGDASFRRYFRVVEPARQAVLMDAPPEHEDCRPFLAVAAHLHGIGFAAPKIYAADLGRGLVLIEDFGDARMAETLAADPALEQPVYRNATVYVAWEHKMIDVLAKRLMTAHCGAADAVPKWHGGDFDGLYVIKITWASTGSSVSFTREEQGLRNLSSACPK